MTNKIYIGDKEINAGGGSSFDPTDINSSLNALDASSKAYDASLKDHQSYITVLIQGYNENYSNIDDISTRLSTIESDYVTSDDISVYYTKSHIDSSYGVIDTSLKAFDASIKELAQSGGGSGGGGGDMSNYATKSDISTFKPIIYTNLSTYEEDVSDGTIDENSMYVITDLASSDELSNIVTIEDLNAEKARINDSLNESGDEVITAANSSMNYWKTTNVSQCQSQCNSAKNSAVSAVQSQQTTSVNAVNTAKNTAISEIDTKMAEMKSFEVITEAEYA